VRKTPPERPNRPLRPTPPPPPRAAAEPAEAPPPTAPPPLPPPPPQSHRWIWGLPVLAPAAGALALWLRRRRAAAAAVAVEQAAQARGVAELLGHDPEFDATAFLARARRTAERVLECWAAGNMAPVRRLLSDGSYVRFQTRLDLLRADGVRNVVADFRLESAELLAAEADRLWDTVHVKVVAATRAADVSLSVEERQARRAAKAAPVVERPEVWSFARRRGVRTRGGAPALEGRCPSCGAQLAPPDAVRCGYCQAVLNSGEHDWVFADATPPEEWCVDPTEQEIPGMRELRQRDPSLSRQELEDRASVIYWKWVAARVRGDRSHLARFSMGGLESGDDGRLFLARARWKNVTVVAIELLGVEPDGAEESDGFDRAMVEVRWIAGGAGPAAGGEEPETMAHLFVLARSSDAQSRRGLSSLDCPTCDGALGDSDTTRCPHCAEALPGGRLDWAVESVAAKESPDSGAWRMPRTG
jgi:hypothetical protein